MKYIILPVLFFFILPDALANPRKAYPHEILGVIARYEPPLIEFENTPIEDAVEFTLTIWRNILVSDGAPFQFAVELDFSAAKPRTVTLKRKDMTVGSVIDALFPEHNYKYTISEGLLLFTVTP